MLKFLGYLCIGFGILDFGLFYMCDVDLTGVSWSPYVASLIGGVLVSIANKNEAQEQEEALQEIASNEEFDDEEFDDEDEYDEEFDDDEFDDEDEDDLDFE